MDDEIMHISYWNSAMCAVLDHFSPPSLVWNMHKVLSMLWWNPTNHVDIWLWTEIKSACDDIIIIVAIMSSCAHAEVHSSVSYIRVMQVIICMHDDSQASSPPSRSHTCDEAACAFNWPGGEGVAARLLEWYMYIYIYIHTYIQQQKNTSN